MSSSTPIYVIAKELNIDNQKIILACNNLGINAKGSTKRLNKNELEKVKNYFEKGKNASQEIIDLKSNEVIAKHKFKYFPNRLVRKS